MIQQIGRYQILEPLGQGSMATVYKAHDPKIGRTLAIKVLRPERCTDEEYRMRFLREAKAAGALSHSNIVTMYDVGEVENTPYIAMELLDGTPLDELMKKGGKLDLVTVLRYALQLAEALHYAHTNGVIHRDVKPSNIVVLRDGVTVKITDFGIARLEASDVTQQTQMGEVLGTPQYMSPEQILGKNADARSDLFSLGVILYQLLSGEKPFKATTLATLLFQIATENPEPIGQLAPQLPSALKQIVEKLLRKQPEKRFQSGKDLAHALRSVLDDVKANLETSTKEKIIPFHIKWSLIMTSIVAVTMIMVGTYLYQKQHKAMTDQVLNYGGSLSRFVATESAEAVLSEDWAAIELFVQDAIQRQDFSYLTVIDHKSIVRGNSRKNGVGQLHSAPPVLGDFGNVAGIIVRAVDDNGTTVLDFDAPIQFQDTEVGRVHLGLPKAPLDALATQMIAMLAILVLVTLIAVGIITYVLGRRVTAPVSALAKGMDEMSAGHYSYRLAGASKDEFGQLFRQFDHMAETLQKQEETRAVSEPLD